MDITHNDLTKYKEIGFSFNKKNYGELKSVLEISFRGVLRYREQIQENVVEQCIEALSILKNDDARRSSKAKKESIFNVLEE